MCVHVRVSEGGSQLNRVTPSLPTARGPAPFGPPRGSRGFSTRKGVEARDEGRAEPGGGRARGGGEARRAPEAAPARAVAPLLRPADWRRAGGLSNGRRARAGGAGARGAAARGAGRARGLPQLPRARARAGPGDGGGAGARRGALQRPAGISSAREEVPVRGCVRARERGAARPPRARAGLQPSRDFPAGGGGGRRPFPAPRHGAARGAGRCGPRRRTRPAPLSRPSGADAGKGPGGWRAAGGSIPGGSIPRPRRRAGPGPVGAGPGRRRPGARRRVPGTAPPRPSPSPGPPAPRTPQLRETLSSGPAGARGPGLPQLFRKRGAEASWKRDPPSGWREISISCEAVCCGVRSGPIRVST